MPATAGQYTNHYNKETIIYLVVSLYTNRIVLSIADLLILNASRLEFKQLLGCFQASIGQYRVVHRLLTFR